jgi:hypothetical protein
MSDLILKLALQAMHDEDALPVLADAIEDADWHPRDRVHLSMDPGLAVALITVDSQPDGWPLYEHHVRAIAALLLFGRWPTSWPLADRCWDNDVYEVRLSAPVNFEPGMSVTVVSDGTAFMVNEDAVVEVRDGQYYLRRRRPAEKESEGR